MSHLYCVAGSAETCVNYWSDCSPYRKMYINMFNAQMRDIANVAKARSIGFPMDFDAVKFCVYTREWDLDTNPSLAELDAARELLASTIRYCKLNPNKTPVDVGRWVSSVLLARALRSAA